MPEQMLTTEQKREKRIAQLRAKLQKEEAKQADSQRKKRNGQLISWGILVEEVFKNADEASRQQLIDSAKKHLKNRNLQRALEGFARLGWACL